MFSRRTAALVLSFLVVGALPAGSTEALSQLPVPWNLDRINQVDALLDGNTSFGTLTGEGVDIYVVDTGVRPTHEQLNGRVITGFDAPTANGQSVVEPRGSDCDGHGTHVASVAAGTTTGVASMARVVSVRVLDCNGDGEISDVVQALQWIRAHHQSGRTAVANLSLGVDLGDDGSEIIEMVRSLVADGIVVVVAAGNGDGTGKGIDACRIAPGNDDVSFTVGAVTKSDSVTAYSNYGPCVDIWAPGGDRTNAVGGAWYRSDSDYMGDIGTSMAAPHVAGVVALLAQQQPGLCPSQYVEAVTARATPNVITGMDGTSNNRLLFADTSPVTSLHVPGRPSNLVVTPDSTSLLVGWDPPCDGGSVISSYRVSLLHGGKVVRRTNVDGTKHAVRIRGLVPGRTYSVVVKPSNAVGSGVATGRVTAPRVASLRKGRTVKVDSLVSTDTETTVTLRSLTPRTCAVTDTGLRGLSTGTCRYAVRPVDTQYDVVRSIRVAG